MNKIIKSFREELNERMAHNDATFNNVYANIDIGYDTDSPLFGLRKLGIPAELITKIQHLITSKQDFALAAPNDEIVYFIGKRVMVCCGRETTITSFATEKEFENGLKLTIIGHRELVAGARLNGIRAYQLIAARVAPPII